MKTKRILLTIAACLTFCACNESANTANDADLADRDASSGAYDATIRIDAGPSCYPPSTTWAGEVPQPELASPAYLDSTIDPTFGTTITRITSGLWHHYSKTQPWNSDGSILFMDRGGQALIDGTTFDVLDKPSAPDGERRWASTDPNRMFHISGAEFLSYKPSIDQSTVLHDFTENGCDRIRLGPWEGNLSIDDKRVALACQQGSDLRVILYGIDTDTIKASRLFPGRWGDDNVDWISVSQSGAYVVINWADDEGVRTYDANADLAPVATLTSDGSHGDACVDPEGNEVYVQMICGGHPDRDVAGIMSYRLDTGEKTIIIPSDDFVCVGHISCRNYRRPGWVYVSSGTHKEVFAAKLDGSQTVQRFTHTHQSYASHSDHFEILGVPSPDGCEVMWASDWAGEVSAYTAKQN